MIYDNIGGRTWRCNWNIEGRSLTVQRSQEDQGSRHAYQRDHQLDKSAAAKRRMEGSHHGSPGQGDHQLRRNCRLKELGTRGYGTLRIVSSNLLITSV